MVVKAHKENICPAVVLSTHTTGSGVIRALGTQGVPVIAVYYDKKDMGYVSKYVSKRIYCPHPEKDESGFIATLAGCGKSLETKGVLIPCDDFTLVSVSKHKAFLSKWFSVACSGWEIIRSVIDKHYTYALAGKIGIQTPATFVPKSWSEAREMGMTIKYPCLIKPFQSHLFYEIFKVKMIRVENREELLGAYNDAVKHGLEVLVQELIPGGDSCGINYNSYFLNGKPIAEFTAEKVRMSPPLFGVPSVVISKSIPEVYAQGRSILSALGYYGYSCTEFKRDPRDGVYKFMEINGRHNRSTLLAVRCGINFPWMEYRYLSLGKHPSSSQAREGIYWIDEFRDLTQSIHYIRSEGCSPVQYVKPYVKAHIFSTFNPRDVLPFIKRSCDIAGMAFKTITERIRRQSLKMRRKGRRQRIWEAASPKKTSMTGSGRRFPIFEKRK